MDGNAPLRGIERKILTSILSVATLPLIIALFVGIYIAREGQSSAVEETLLTAATTKTSGLRIASNSQLNSISRLAVDGRVVAALTPRTGGQPIILDSPQATRDLNDYLGRYTSAESPETPPSVIVLYDAKGHVVTSTQPLPEGIQDAAMWAGSVRRPQYVDLNYSPMMKAYLAQTVAPVHSLQNREIIGFVSEILDINSLIKFALGYDPYRDEEPMRKGQYQIAYPVGSDLVATYLDPESDPQDPVLKIQPLDQDIAQLLLSPDTDSTGTLRVYRGLFSGVFLAYDRLFDTYDVFILVSRPTTEIFGTIYFWALVATGVCILFIAFLCLQAYRNVHNNIVRPVLLLNEGAQIIGQGDLELKLKIGTGDEIEELASSFNKMALALKRNIRQLEESEEKYRSLVTSMRDGILQTDPDGNISFLNPAGVEIFGFAQPDDAIGEDMYAMFVEATDLDRFREEMFQRGFVERSRVWMKRRDQREICVELSGNLVHGDEGEVAGVEGIFRDVTKSVRLEREARDRAERLSAINQIANVINSSLEAGRLYESLVVEVKKLIDFDYAELALLNDAGDAFDTRQLWPEQAGAATKRYGLNDEDCPSAWVAQKQECLIADEMITTHAQYLDKFPPGTRACLCVPLYATGRIIGTLNLASNRAQAFSHHDVEVLEQMAPHVAVAIRNAQLLENLQQSLEEVTRAREKLHEANEELKTLDEMKTNLLSNVSHELRTPLVAVMGYTDMIANGKVGPINDVQREYLSISLRNIEKLVTLIENLLDFSRLHRGAETLAFDEFDLVECARTSLQIVQPVADSREIELAVVAPPDPVIVEGDKGKLGQVFNNLLSNAVKFNNNGGSVTVEINSGEDEVDVVVRDTGIGIPAEALDKVFTRFYQYDSSSTRKYGGTGIGLSIAQDIMRLHGSRITVTSEIGKGSAFRFKLPLRARRDERALSSTPEFDTAGTRLLVELASPDRALSTQVRTLLQSEGMEVIHALSISQALALAHRHSPDCLLVDMDWGDQDRDVLDTILADPACGRLPIIILTNEDAVYERYRSLVASRIKRSFRKSTLLSGIHYALKPGALDNESLGHRILCVDDDQEIVQFITRCLEGEGYEVFSCSTGEEALAQLSTQEYALVLLDIAMPGMDGWETCKRIKLDPALTGIKVYVVTAKPIDGMSQRYIECGADGYLLKPFHADDLLELVQAQPLVRIVKEV